MCHVMRVIGRAYPLIVRLRTPYISRRQDDLIAAIGGLERLQTQAQVRQERRYGTCEGRFAGPKPAPFEYC